VTHPPAGTIEARDLVLEYPIYRHIVLDRMRTLVGRILPGLRPEMRRVLDKISFAIGPGEIVGVIGRNGAGKTSLLKLISGLISPDGGAVRTSGRVMALLTMGVGFRPNLTGRENLRLGALLMGMSGAEIAGALEPMIAFAGLDASIDQPFFSYSTGMRARLAIALATNVDADIMILDETLATGDAAFAGKCYARIDELRRSGRTILFVSHNLGEIARLTSRTIVLEKGAIVHDGEVLEGLRLYEDLLIATVALGTGRHHRLQPRLEFFDGEGAPATRAVVGRPLRVDLVVRSAEALGPSFLVLRLHDVRTGQLLAYLMPDRWRVTPTEGEIGNDNVDIRAGVTRISLHIPWWTAGEGAVTFDAYLGPPTDLTRIDMSEGRYWQSIGYLPSVYRNPYLRGANTLLEMVVDACSVSHEPDQAPAASASFQLPAESVE
jgi:ABC-type polysaccharide/polyol phosphate transport system ATPase subunit